MKDHKTSIHKNVKSKSYKLNEYLSRHIYSTPNSSQHVQHHATCHTCCTTLALSLLNSLTPPSSTTQFFSLFSLFMLIAALILLFVFPPASSGALSCWIFIFIRQLSFVLLVGDYGRSIFCSFCSVCEEVFQEFSEFISIEIREIYWEIRKKCKWSVRAFIEISNANNQFVAFKCIAKVLHIISCSNKIAVSRLETTINFVRIKVVISSSSREVYIKT